jgi:phosphoribosylamine--glycine ligase
LCDVLIDIAEHRLSSSKLAWRPDAAATIVLVAGGYPGKVENGKEIFGLDEAQRIDGVKVFHAGTQAQAGKFYTTGGRVLNVTARGDTLKTALERAYSAARMIEFEGKDCRKDIGKKGLAKQR